MGVAVLLATARPFVVQGVLAFFGSPFVGGVEVFESEADGVDLAVSTRIPTGHDYDLSIAEFRYAACKRLRKQ